MYISSENLNKIRHDILNDMMNDSIYEVDILKLLCDDWEISKFYYHLNNDDILNKIIQYCKWKKNNYYNKKDEDFPIEFWKMSYEMYGKDKNNRKILWTPSTLKNINFNIKYIIDLFKLFYMYYIEKLDNEIHGTAIIIMHAKFLSINFTNIDFLKFFFNLKFKYYRNQIEIINVIDVPRKYLYFYRFLINFISVITRKKDIKLLAKDDLKQITFHHVIPINYGGSRIQKLSSRYKTCKSLNEICFTYSIPEKYILEFYEVNQWLTMC